MKLKSVKALAVAGVTAVVVVIGSGTAFASVTWRNAWANGYLQDSECSFGCGYIDLAASGDSGTLWNDTKYSDGGWTEKSESGHCLDSNFNGQVYPHSCLSGDIYQRWYEISTPTGWALEDDETGHFLDVDSNQNVYANSTNYGDSDAHQRWH